MERLINALTGRNKDKNKKNAKIVKENEVIVPDVVAKSIDTVGPSSDAVDVVKNSNVGGALPKTLEPKKPFFRDDSLEAVVKPKGYGGSLLMRGKTVDIQEAKPRGKFLSREKSVDSPDSKSRMKSMDIQDSKSKGKQLLREKSVDSQEGKFRLMKDKSVDSDEGKSRFGGLLKSKKEVKKEVTEAQVELRQKLPAKIRQLSEDHDAAWPIPQEAVPSRGLEDIASTESSLQDISKITEIIAFVDDDEEDIISDGKSGIASLEEEGSSGSVEEKTEKENSEKIKDDEVLEKGKKEMTENIEKKNFNEIVAKDFSRKADFVKTTSKEERTSPTRRPIRQLTRQVSSTSKPLDSKVRTKEVRISPGTNFKETLPGNGRRLIKQESLGNRPSPYGVNAKALKTGSNITIQREIRNNRVTKSINRQESIDRLPPRRRLENGDLPGLTKTQSVRRPPGNALQTTQLRR